MRRSGTLAKLRQAATRHPQSAVHRPERRSLMPTLGRTVKELKL
jgi:hypothetical protein